ncbi:TetR family transcriptional regulator [Microbispora amethystogenes]|uniref:TetR family transcriptional regulator n=2 Tax=Microbispora TaxID=2005 RepID=A0A5J5KDA2_9ACTN|nr:MULTISPECIES: TetR family transcriptional regulator [Microbispora]KAA9381894.1 TetR family transcriptional regulator [Microbispora cellulosiformans]GIH30908.1 TetR family transcriptional regulator [Microbispora amethystogenes]
MSGDDGRPGLRERKKQETRIALSWAAIRLVVERGLENVRVEDIAAEAGVAPRTFNNYFSSKGEAIAARHLERTRMIAQELRRRPASEPLWEAITSAVITQLAMGADYDDRRPDQQWQAGIRLMISEPSLQGEMLRASAIAENELAAAIAERTGTDVDHDLYPRLVAGAAGAAIRVAMDQWLRASPPVPVRPLIEDALGRLAAGLPEPRSS